MTIIIIIIILLIIIFEKVFAGPRRYYSVPLSVSAVEYLSAGEDNTIEWKLTEPCVAGSRFVTIDTSFIDLVTPTLDRVARFNPHGTSGGYLETQPLDLLLRPPLEFRAWLYRDTLRAPQIGKVFRLIDAQENTLLSFAEAWSPTDAQSGAIVNFADGREWTKCGCCCVVYFIVLTSLHFYWYLYVCVYVVKRGRMPRVVVSGNMWQCAYSSTTDCVTCKCTLTASKRLYLKPTALRSNRAEHKATSSRNKNLFLLLLFFYFIFIVLFKFLEELVRQQRRIVFVSANSWWANWTTY